MAHRSMDGSRTCSMGFRECHISLRVHSTNKRFINLVIAILQISGGLNWYVGFTCSTLGCITDPKKGPPNQWSAKVGDGIFTLDPTSAQSVYAMRQQGLPQGVSGPHWGNNTEASTGNMSQFGPHSYISSFQKSNVNSHSWQQASTKHPSRTTSQSQVRVGSSPTQPQWQLGQPSISPHATTTSFGPSVGSLKASEPSCGSYPTTRTTGELTKDFPAQSSQYSGPSLPDNGSFAARNGLQTTQPSFPAHSNVGMDFSHSTSDRQTSLCDSHQGTAFQQAPAPGPVGHPFQYAYPSQSFVANEDRHGNAMPRIHSGAAFNSTVDPVFVENQAGIQHFQNPLVQAGVQHYLPSHQPNSVRGTTGYLRYEHLYNHHSHLGNAKHRLSQVAAPNPQFVSGPWESSTPPTFGPMEPTHYH